MALTAVAVTGSKPKEKQYKLSDARGLYLLVTPQGHKYWRFNYRYDGKHRTLALGVFPDVSLADARSRRDEARRSLAAGEDPIERRQRIEREARAERMHTFKTIGEEWLSRLKTEGRADKTIRKMRWLLEMALPGLGNRPIAQLTAVEILDVLRKVEARGRHETAIRLRGTIGAILRYGVVTGRAQRDVTIDLRGALIIPKVVHRAAILEPKAVGALLRAIDSYEGQPTVEFALKLSPHLFVRPAELRTSEWEEIDFSVNEWKIPKEKTKMRRPHRVPLSRQSKALLLELKKITGHTRYLFPSVRSEERPITDNTINAALRRMGYGKSEMTGHGFRAMASTLLNESGKWNPDAIERQLGHVDENHVRRAYARGEYWPERVRMMQAWSNYLDKLRVLDRSGK